MIENEDLGEVKRAALGQMAVGLGEGLRAAGIGPEAAARVAAAVLRELLGLVVSRSRAVLIVALNAEGALIQLGTDAVEMKRFAERRAAAGDLLLGFDPAKAVADAAAAQEDGRATVH